MTYASAYSRTPADAMPGGFHFQAIDAKGVAHAPTAAEQAAWWSDSAGIPPGAGLAETRAALPQAGLPVIVLHGADNGLVIEAFSGGAYAAWAKASGRDQVRYWKVGHAQHFDAFLGLPVLGASYLPMLPYGYRAMDRMWAHVAEGKPLPGSMEITPRRRALGTAGLAPLSAEDLALP